MKVSLLLTFGLLYSAQSAMIARVQVDRSSLCSYANLVRQSACHCFIASHTKVFPEKMAEYCHEDYGKDLNRLSPFCVQYVNKQGKFDLDMYLTAAKQSHQICYSPHSSFVSRQIGFDSPFDPYFGSQNGQGGSPNFYGSPQNPLHLGPIDLTWSPVYQTRNGPDFYGLDVNAQFPIHGGITGNIGVGTNSDIIRGGGNPNVNFGINIPF